MGNVVRNESTKRKLDWQAEEQLRVSKKMDRARRDLQRFNREAKWADDSCE
jgi:hypothetical protein